MNNNTQNANFSFQTRHAAASPEPANGLFHFGGRIGRLSYFWVLLVVTVVSSPVPYLVKLSEGGSSGFFFLIFVEVILFLLISFVAVAAGVKRCHDLGKPGWHLWWSVVPIANFIFGLYLLFTKGVTGSNKYGPSLNKSTTSPSGVDDTSWKSPLNKAAISPNVPSSPARDRSDAAAPDLTTAIPKPNLSSANQATALASHAVSNATQFVNQTQSPKSMPLSTPAEEDFWATAMNEVETGQRRPGVWAKAFAESDGDETKAKVAYLKVRVQQLTDVEKDRRAEVAREQAELQEHERLKVEAQLAEQQLTDTVSRFQAGNEPSCDDVKVLASLAERDSKVALLTDQLKGNNLLHWCARLDLYQEAATLLRHGADATKQNGYGRQPYQLADDYALNALLKAAANKPKGTCPNCATVMPLTSQICPKCSAFFEEGAAWKLIPVS